MAHGSVGEKRTASTLCFDSSLCASCIWMELAGSQRGTHPLSTAPDDFASAKVW
jgi:hypothetical protein